MSRVLTIKILPFGVVKKHKKIFNISIDDEKDVCYYLNQEDKVIQHIDHIYVTDQVQ